MDPYGYFRPNLLGGSIEYDIDLSETGCGCVANINLVRMPAFTGRGEPNISDMYYYCSSNPGGAVCPMFNIMEANKYSWRTDAHACDAPEKPG